MRYGTLPTYGSVDEARFGSKMPWLMLWRSVESSNAAAVRRSKASAATSGSVPPRRFQPQEVVALVPGAVRIGGRVVHLGLADGHVLAVVVGEHEQCRGLQRQVGRQRRRLGPVPGDDGGHPGVPLPELADDDPAPGVPGDAEALTVEVRSQRTATV